MWAIVGFRMYIFKKSHHIWSMLFIGANVNSTCRNVHIRYYIKASMSLKHTFICWLQNLAKVSIAALNKHQQGTGAWCLALALLYILIFGSLKWINLLSRTAVLKELQDPTVEYDNISHYSCLQFSLCKLQHGQVGFCQMAGARCLRIKKHH